MGAVIYREVIDGHLTEARMRLQKSDGQRPGYKYIEVLAWKGAEKLGEPAMEWEMPKELYLEDAAQAGPVTVASQRAASRPGGVRAPW